MKYTPRLEKAIKFAAQRHDGQLRIEKERLPYITHLISVAILVSTHIEDEDCIIAALLHDVLEDTKTTLAEITDLFGGTVASYVDAVTEKKIPDWNSSKQGYIDQLRIAPEKALIIAAADKMHNIASRLSLAEEAGIDIFAQWSHTPAEYHWYHRSVYEVLSKRLKNSIVRDFELMIKNEEAVFGIVV